MAQQLSSVKAGADLASECKSLRYLHICLCFPLLLSPVPLHGAQSPLPFPSLLPWLAEVQPYSLCCSLLAVNLL